MPGLLDFTFNDLALARNPLFNLGVGLAQASAPSPFPQSFASNLGAGLGFAQERAAAGERLAMQREELALQRERHRAQLEEFQFKQQQRQQQLQQQQRMQEAFPELLASLNLSGPQIALANLAGPEAVLPMLIDQAFAQEVGDPSAVTIQTPNGPIQVPFKSLAESTREVLAAGVSPDSPEGIRMIAEIAEAKASRTQVTVGGQSGPRFLTSEEKTAAGFGEGAIVVATPSGIQEIRADPEQEAEFLQERRETERLAEQTEVQPSRRQAAKTALAKERIAHRIIDDAIPKINFLSTGVVGQFIDFNTPTGLDLRALLISLGGVVATQELQALRQASPNGASGFGQLTAIEFEALKSSIAALQQEQSGEQLKKHLMVIRSAMTKLRADIENDYEQTYGEPALTEDDLNTDVKSFDEAPD